MKHAILFGLALVAGVPVHADTVSSWAYHWDDSMSAPEPKKLDGFGLGNGGVFSLEGTRLPLNTLHNTVGPRFGSAGEFYGDMALALAQDGDGLEFNSEDISHVKRAPVNETRGVAKASAGLFRRSDVELSTVDFALIDKPVIVREIRVKNIGGRTVKDLRLQGLHWSPISAAGSGFTQERDGGYVGISVDAPVVNFFTEAPWKLEHPYVHESLLQWALLRKGPKHEVSVWECDIPELEPGAEWTTTVYLTFFESAPGALAEERASRIDDLLRGVRVKDPDPRRSQVEDHWRQWFAQGTQIHVSDPKVEDLFDEVALAIKLQQEPNGGVSPLSRYTKSWLRDTIGPLRYFLALGRAPEAKAMADYLYKASIQLQRISNSYPNSLVVPVDAPMDPGAAFWESVPLMPGRKAVEAPSYLPLELDRYWRWTGDLSPLQERYEFLKRAVTGQLGSRAADGALPMSGDETWRTDMVLMSWKSAWDFAQHQDENRLSVESHFLLSAAADVMGRLAHELGKADDEALFRRISQESREAANRIFWNDERGYYVPFLIQGGSKRSAAPDPLTHVQLMAIWSGFLDPRDKSQQHTALLNLASTLDDAHAEPNGIPNTHSVLGSRLEIFTGMEPGLWLWNFTAAGLEQAEDAYRFMLEAATPSGNFFEFYQRKDDSSARIIDDPYGSIGNATSLYRPWEGGTNLEALFRYLVGVEPDLRSSQLEILPHLPAGLTRVAAEGIRLGSGTLDLEYSIQGRALSLKLRPHGLGGVRARVGLPLPAECAASDGLPRLNGESYRAAEMSGVPEKDGTEKTLRLLSPLALESKEVTLEVECKPRAE